MTMLCRRLSWILVAFFIISPSIASAQMADKKSSPFEALRWNGDSPEVMIQSDWYRPLTIQGVDIENILAFCKDRYGGKAKKRFELRNSDVEVSCASMASFRPDGRLYDGRGIEVDAEVDPIAEFLFLDGEDNVLDAAIEHIRSH